jgi:hypothetical protein
MSGGDAEAEFLIETFGLPILRICHQSRGPAGERSRRLIYAVSPACCHVTGFSDTTLPSPPFPLCAEFLAAIGVPPLDIVSV